ncbi:unnamed protein product, partial [Pylaiella littoralis]
LTVLTQWYRHCALALKTSQLARSRNVERSQVVFRQSAPAFPSNTHISAPLDCCSWLAGGDGLRDASVHVYEVVSWSHFSPPVRVDEVHLVPFLVSIPRWASSVLRPFFAHFGQCRYARYWRAISRALVVQRKMYGIL